jgi:hypothetical protein
LADQRDDPKKSRASWLVVRNRIFVKASRISVSRSVTRTSEDRFVTAPRGERRFLAFSDESINPTLWKENRISNSTPARLAFDIRWNRAADATGIEKKSIKNKAAPPAAPAADETNFVATAWA